MLCLYPTTWLEALTISIEWLESSIKMSTGLVVLKLSAWTDRVTCKEELGVIIPIPISPWRLKSDTPSIVKAAVPLFPVKCACRYWRC